MRLWAAVRRFIMGDEELQERARLAHELSRAQAKASRASQELRISAARTRRVAHKDAKLAEETDERVRASLEGIRAANEIMTIRKARDPRG